ncbi:MAG: ATP-dependent DNA helicase RecG [Fretibacterium sp.]|nr:ATP-dependent DNA helicase RecG [Fretibacterium sp.]
MWDKTTHDRVELNSSVRYLRGVGERRAEALARLGVLTIEDILLFFPRRYEDRRRLTPLDELRPGESVCAVAEVLALAIPEGPAPASALLSDGRAAVRAVWFNPHIGRVLKPGVRVALFGRVEYYNGIQLSNPEFEVLTDQPPQLVGRIIPIYPAAASLSQKRIQSLVDDVFKTYGDRLVDVLPAKIRKKYGMKGFREAVHELHHPSDARSWVKARNRLAFDELFLLQAGLLLRRASASAQRSVRSLSTGKHFEQFMKSLPFPLTRAQTRAIEEILEAMRGMRAMNRLLQGDVGSGKTLVALAAVLAAVDSGAQAVLMAPTGILAQQHYMTLHRLLAPLGICVGLLTGSLRAEERRTLLADLQAGELQVLVGTHAVFAEKVSFADLGLVVVDEQHRFGVLQKNALIAKGTAPHVLVMTATPIPRTLVLSVYGDLDVSVLDELPPGRKPVRTLSMKPEEEGALLTLIRTRVCLGQQVYWVCPLIEDSEEGRADLSSVSSCCERLAKLLPGVRIEMLHGRLPMEEKIAAMRRFAEGEIDLLVATAVIEVGMDVPNATLMVIEDAGQFGLAQLHQLRGRVGRGEAESLCVLLEGQETTPEGRERIEAMLHLSDGFALAEADLKQRGPGEVCGVRQHGVTDFRVANLMRDHKILDLARREAQSLLREDPALDTEPLFRAALMRRLGKTLQLAGTA